MRLCSPQWALKVADQVRAFSSALAHSEAFIPYTHHDSVVLIQEEGRTA